MMTIEERVSRHLNPTLRACLKQRVQAGVEKYGQTLDANIQPQCAKAVHLIQELLDAAQYAEWLGHGVNAGILAEVANDYQVAFELSADEIMAGGKE